MINKNYIEKISEGYEEKSEKILGQGVLDLIEKYIDSNNSERRFYEFVLATNPEDTKIKKHLINDSSFKKAYRNLKIKTGLIDFNQEKLEKDKLLENLVLMDRNKEEFFQKHVNETFAKNNSDIYQFAWETYKVPDKFKKIYFQKFPEFDYPKRQKIQKLLFNGRSSHQKTDENQLSLFQE